MTQCVKYCVCKCENRSLDSQNPWKTRSGKVNLWSLPSYREVRVQTGKSLEVHGAGSLVYAVANKIPCLGRGRKSRTNSWGCFLTSTSAHGNTPPHTHMCTQHTHIFFKCMKQLCLARRAVQRGWWLWIGFSTSSYSNCCFLGSCFLQREGERAGFLFRSNWHPSISHSLSLCVEFNLRLSLRSPFLTRHNKGHLCSSSDLQAPTQCPNAPKIISE